MVNSSVESAAAMPVPSAAGLHENIDLHAGIAGSRVSAFLGVLSRSLWRNSCRLEALIKYAIGAILSHMFVYPSTLFAFVWGVLMVAKSACLASVSIASVLMTPVLYSMFNLMRIAGAFLRYLVTSAMLVCWNGIRAFGVLFFCIIILCFAVAALQRALRQRQHRGRRNMQRRKMRPQRAERQHQLHLQGPHPAQLVTRRHVGHR